MNWMFVVDIIFYAIVGFLAFPVFVLMLALAFGDSYKRGYERLKGFLVGWAEIGSQGFLDKVLRVSGVTGVLFLLGFGGYVANRVGDAALPHTAGWFRYFGSAEVDWSINHKDQWKNDVEWNFREVTEIGPDRLKWEAAKAAMGRYDVRLFRSMAVVSAAVVLAASIGLIVGCFKKVNQGTNLAALLVGAFMVVGSHWLWVEREEQYIENLTSRYISEFMKTHNGELPKTPASYPTQWGPPTVRTSE